MPLPRLQPQHPATLLTNSNAEEDVVRMKEATSAPEVVSLV
jgi:hypothetical protein